MSESRFNLVVDWARNECVISDLNLHCIDTKHTHPFISDVHDDVMALICGSAGLERQQRLNMSRFSR